MNKNVRARKNTHTLYEHFQCIILDSPATARCVLCIVQWSTNHIFDFKFFYLIIFQGFEKNITDLSQDF